MLSSAKYTICFKVSGVHTHNLSETVSNRWLSVSNNKSIIIIPRIKMCYFPSVDKEGMEIGVEITCIKDTHDMSIADIEAGENFKEKYLIYSKEYEKILIEIIVELKKWFNNPIVTIEKQSCDVKYL